MSRWGRDVDEIKLDIAEIVGDGETDVIEALRRKKRLRSGDDR